MLTQSLQLRRRIATAADRSSPTVVVCLASMPKARSGGKAAQAISAGCAQD